MGRKRKSGGGGEGPTNSQRLRIAAAASQTRNEESPPNSDVDEPQVEDIIKVELDPESESYPGEDRYLQELFGVPHNQDLASDPQIDIGEVEVKVLQYPYPAEEGVDPVDSKMISEPETPGTDLDTGGNDATISSSGVDTGPTAFGNGTVSATETDETNSNFSSDSNGTPLLNQTTGKEKPEGTDRTSDEGTSSTMLGGQHVTEGTTSTDGAQANKPKPPSLQEETKSVRCPEGAQPHPAIFKPEQSFPNDQKVRILGIPPTCSDECIFGTLSKIGEVLGIVKWGKNKQQIIAIFASSAIAVLAVTASKLNLGIKHHSGVTITVNNYQSQSDMVKGKAAQAHGDCVQAQAMTMAVDPAVFSPPRGIPIGLKLRVSGFSRNCTKFCVFHVFSKIAVVTGVICYGWRNDGKIVAFRSAESVATVRRTTSMGKVRHAGSRIDVSTFIDNGEGMVAWNNGHFGAYGGHYNFGAQSGRWSY